MALLFMVQVTYTKPHASALKRVEHLRAKGLHIPQRNVAAKKIDAIGYERLRIYFLSRRQVNVAGKPFIPGITYNHILRLYQCDSAIRDACFSAVGQFELLLRNSMSEALSSTFGSHPYHEIAAFRNAGANLSALQTFVQVYAKSKDGRARHYQTVYSDPILPPIWTMKEFLTFGTASRILNELSGPLQKKIADDFGVGKEQILTNWVAALVDLRNICAHHDRLFNRSFQKQPSKLKSAGIPSAQPNKLKGILECLDYLLEQRGTPVNVTQKVGAVIVKYKEMQPGEAGY
ncbi:MAG: Abi family protein [Thalassospira sp.]|uniref:Abi family protein n=1 Tax=Thalassospira sp. TaxID=1912094 RepID=UPI0032ECBB88